MDLINWIMLNLYPSNMSVLFGHYDTRHIQTSDYQGWTQVQLPGVKAPPTYVRSLKLLKPTLQTNSKKIIYLSFIFVLSPIFLLHRAPKVEFSGSTLTGYHIDGSHYGHHGWREDPKILHCGGHYVGKIFWEGHI